MTVPGLFGVQAARAPGSVAVVCGEVSLTYGELDVRASRLACRLAELGAGPESVVAVVMERSADLVVALLGVLKAGAAYLPVDGRWPAARLGVVLADCGARVVVADAVTSGQELVRAALAGGAEVVVAGEDAGEGGGAGLAGGWLADQAAYVMYTSGSTVRDVHVGVDGAAEGGGGHSS